jgi:hypothetical protein
MDTRRDCHRALRSAACLTFVLSVGLGGAESAFAACGQPPHGQPGVWCYVDGARVRVWWNRSFASDEGAAARLRDDAEGHLWPLYEGVLGRVPLSDGARFYPRNGGDGRYDIVLATDVRGLYGETPLVASTSTGTPPARFSMILRTLPATRLRPALAHELMHGFLTAFRCAGKCRWLEEATATWSEHLAYPAVNTEHQYTAGFFKDPTRSLHDDQSDQDPHKNGAYLFLLFLQHHGRSTQGNPTLVGDVWNATETFSDPLPAIDATVPGGFKRVWREFIVDNWNADPVFVGRGAAKAPPYVYWDGVADGVLNRKAFAREHTVTTGSAGAQMPLSIGPLRPLSAAYFRVKFDALDVRSVRVIHNLQALRAAGRSGAELAVFSRIRGRGWRIESEWRNEDRHLFCRDKAAERIDEIVVILANSSFASTVDFRINGVWPAVVASAATCLTDNDPGFQECVMSFRRQHYQHSETQTWTTTSPPTGRVYPYRWTTAGAGFSTDPDNPDWSARWTVGGDAEGAIEVSLQPANGEQEAVAVNQQLRKFKGVEGTQTRNGRSTPFDNTAWEFGPPHRTAPLGALRIEGIDTGPLDPSWQGGIAADIPQPGTFTCRWSWPRAIP